LPPVRVGTFPARAELRTNSDGRLDALPHHLEAEVDHLCVGDHVSFRVGAGYDGLIAATGLLTAVARLPVYVALYLLPLRHPVPVARQLATIAELAPGRLILGLGIGGEDRHEVEICGIDPRTRGRRMDECLEVVRGLLTGRPLNYQGRFFRLEEALIAPAPSPPIPLVVGGRSAAAIRRAGRLGDGWLAIWVSARRFGEAVRQMEDEAASVDRDPIRFQHGLNVWCGFGKREEARRALSAAMQAFYRIPFESFERYSPYGSPDEVAEFLAPYADAGCSAFNLIPCAPDDAEALEGAAQVHARLAGLGGRDG
jgi:alkanesulfonate monooxygenase SsuD/methylene tetrahydromethanopterin reductase-like flavin-dependent oxidoreductase (luciferase family)